MRYWFNIKRYIDFHSHPLYGFVFICIVPIYDLFFIYGIPLVYVSPLYYTSLSSTVSHQRFPSTPSLQRLYLTELLLGVHFVNLIWILFLGHDILDKYLRKSVLKKRLISRRHNALPAIANLCLYGLSVGRPEHSGTFRLQRSRWTYNLSRHRGP